MKFITFLAIVLCSVNLSAKELNCKDDSQYKDVTKTEMKKIVAASSATILDVNDEAEFKEKGIPGAMHFPTIKKKLASSLPADKNAPIVAYCGGKMCSAWKRAARAACELGYTNKRHFSEGITGWNKKSS